MEKLRILLAEDHSIVREGLKLLVNAQPDMEVIGEAGDGQLALQKAIELQPEVVVMDLSMPEVNGAQATRLLKENSPAIKVLALTVHEDKGYLKELLQAGASGYVLKRAAADELINAIRFVAEGGVYLDHTLASRVVSSFMRNSPTDPSEHENSLSMRESEVLRLIAHGFSNKEIATQMEISVKTVETYKSRGMEKLGMHSRADIVRFALERGWLRDQ